ncbi:MAG: o-succinylbenzoate--CoA ligase, partial [Clostridia bacterium]|nr:o-succinylbenzoate--CoA ligase [Clostridia bacterium]
EVYERVRNLACKLYPLTQKEQRVALFSGNSPQAIIFLYALLLLKKEVLMLNTGLNAQELTRQIEQGGVRLVFSAQEEYFSFAQAEQLPETAVELVWEYDRESIAVIMNTSATTGNFKSVPIRWKQIEAQVQASAQILGVQKEDNWLVVLPIFHVSGLSILFRSLYNGTRLTILPRFQEEKVLELINQGQVNLISLVPTLLKRIIAGIKHSDLRVILLGGEFIPQALIEESQAKGLPIYKTYGMTETMSQSATFNILEYPDKIQAVGRPLPGVEIQIREPDSAGIGEIYLKSPMLMDGYLGQEPLAGYLATGDMGYLDEDGFLFVFNRRKDLIISGGENIYPKEIEDLLYKLPEVRECAVVGKTDEKWGQVPVLYVVSSLAEEELKQYLLQNLAKYKLPRQIIFRSELPKNPSGKILRKQLWESL